MTMTATLERLSLECPTDCTCRGTHEPPPVHKPGECPEGCGYSLSVHRPGEPCPDEATAVLRWGRA